MRTIFRSIIRLIKFQKEGEISDSCLKDLLTTSFGNNELDELINNFPLALILPLGPSATILPETCKFAVGLIPLKIEILSPFMYNKGAVPIPPADGSIANGYNCTGLQISFKLPQEQRKNKESNR